MTAPKGPKPTATDVPAWDDTAEWKKSVIGDLSFDVTYTQKVTTVSMSGKGSQTPEAVAINAIAEHNLVGEYTFTVPTGGGFSRHYEITITDLDPEGKNRDE